MRTITIALVVVVLLALAIAAWAQPAPMIYWEHDGANLTHFTCQIDAGAQADLTGKVVQSSTTYSTLLANCGTLTAGSHLLYIYACNGSSCTTSTGIYVVKL